MRKHRTRALIMGAVAAAAALVAVTATPASATFGGYVSTVNTDVEPSVWNTWVGSDCQVWIHAGSVANGSPNMEAKDYAGDTTGTATCDGIAVYSYGGAGFYPTGVSPTGYFGTTPGVSNLQTGNTAPAGVSTTNSVIVCDRGGNAAPMKWRQFDFVAGDAYPVRASIVQNGCPWGVGNIIWTDDMGGLTPTTWPGTVASPVARSVVAEAETATLAGGPTVVTYGSGFSGTGWVRSFSVGSSITFSGLAINPGTVGFVRITSPFNTNSIRSCIQMQVNGVNLPAQQIIVMGTPQPGGDWTNWSQSALIGIPSPKNTPPLSGFVTINTVKLTRITCSAGQVGNGFNVDGIFSVPGV